MSFYVWLLKKYKNENNQFGNLIRLMAEDKKAPKRARKENEIRRYLIGKKISLKMMRAFNIAFEKYAKEMRSLDN